jgi:HSP20 family molecular chaperone IbpA
MSHTEHVNGLLRHPIISGLTTVYDPVELFNDSPPELNTLSRGRGDSENGPFIPDFDLRETTEAYYIEGEFPGIRGRESINLIWTDASTLHIYGVINRINLDDEWSLLEGTAFEDGCNISRDDISSDHRIPSNSPSLKAPNQDKQRFNVSKSTESSDMKAESHDDVRIWLEERRVGSHSRTISFPNMVDTYAVQARLSQGLLLIKIPKTSRTKLDSENRNRNTSQCLSTLPMYTVC